MVLGVAAPALPVARQRHVRAVAIPAGQTAGGIGVDGVPEAHPARLRRIGNPQVEGERDAAFRGQ
jgi:hypothetical protein